MLPEVPTFFRRGTFPEIHARGIASTEHLQLFIKLLLFSNFYEVKAIMLFFWLVLSCYYY